MNLHENFAKAKTLLRQHPLPDDIEEQLDELRKAVPVDQLEFFDQFREAAIAGAALEP